MPHMFFPVYGPPEKKAHILAQLCGTTWGLKVKRGMVKSKVRKSYEEKKCLSRVRVAFLFPFVALN